MKKTASDLLSYYVDVRTYIHTTVNWIIQVIYVTFCLGQVLDMFIPYTVHGTFVVCIFTVFADVQFTTLSIVENWLHFRSFTEFYPDQ